jgi:GAF domain-containing protein
MTRSPDPRILHRIVSTVGSSLELGSVLNAVVALLSEGSGVRACFVYLMERAPDRLVLSAASPPYERHTGAVVLQRGEGLAWWAAERKTPAFIRENALADPRTKYVPELEEERFQSLLALPVLSRAGDVIGVITAHTEAPREFTDDEVEFLVTSASLVGGAIENARHYEEARRRVAELERLTTLAEAVARADSLEELVRTVAADGRSLLGATACHVYLVDSPSESLALRASDPATAESPERIALSGLGSELTRPRRGRARVSVPLVASGELLGLVVAEGTTRVDLGRALASQAAVGIKKVQLIERLTEKNLIKDFFEQLATGRRAGDVRPRAARLGIDLGQPHVVIEAEPPEEGVEHALRGLAPGLVLDRGEESIRALVTVPRAGTEALMQRLAKLHASLPAGTAFGVSNACVGEASYVNGFDEARQALFASTIVRGQPGVVAYEDLGAYKYLLKVALEGGVRDVTVDAVRRLAEYDAQRGASLVQTLEEYLRRHGSINQTAEALYVHPNTLRQRLRRIAELSGLDLGSDDWLTIEIAVRMVRLRQALGAGGSPGEPASGAADPGRVV